MLIDKLFGDKATREARQHQLEAEQENLRHSLTEMCERQQASWAALRSSGNPAVRFLAKVFG